MFVEQDRHEVLCPAERGALDVSRPHNITESGLFHLPVLTKGDPKFRASLALPRVQITLKACMEDRTHKCGNSEVSECALWKLPLSSSRALPNDLKS
jgi:hypothetical protein